MNELIMLVHRRQAGMHSHCHSASARQECTGNAIPPAPGQHPAVEFREGSSRGYKAALTRAGHGITPRCRYRHPAMEVRELLSHGIRRHSQCQSTGAEPAPCCGSFERSFRGYKTALTRVGCRRSPPRLCLRPRWPSDLHHRRLSGAGEGG